MAKVSNALGVSSDFLMSGSSDDLADSSLTDKELLNQFKAIEKMQDNDFQYTSTHTFHMSEQSHLYLGICE